MSESTRLPAAPRIPALHLAIRFVLELAVFSGFAIWGWHAGAGLEVPITEHVALNADFRWIFLDSKFGKEGTTDLDRDRKADGYVGTAALMFYF